MNTRIRHDKQGPELRDLAMDEVVSVICRSGSIVRVLRGRTWITHDNDAHDYVVPAGMRFCVARDGKVVISAVTEGTRIAIYHLSPAPAAEGARNRVCFAPDFALAARREAQREIARNVAKLLSRLWRGIRQLWLRREVPRHHNAARPARIHGWHCE